MGECILTKKILLNTDTYTATSKSASIDMGQFNTYRYVNTNGVPNSNSETYSATSKSNSIDMGATNTYRYVNTSGVPNSNSGTYTPAAHGTALDMGASNSYRYVNTVNVYNQGYNDRSNTLFATMYSAQNVDIGDNSSGALGWTVTDTGTYVVIAINKSNNGVYPTISGGTQRGTCTGNAWSSGAVRIMYARVSTIYATAGTYITMTTNTGMGYPSLAGFWVRVA